MEKREDIVNGCEMNDEFNVDIYINLCMNMVWGRIFFMKYVTFFIKNLYYYLFL